MLDSLPPTEDMAKLRVAREESHPKSISITILLKLKRLFLSSSFSSERTWGGRERRRGVY